MANPDYATLLPQFRALKTQVDDHQAEIDRLTALRAIQLAIIDDPNTTPAQLIVAQQEASGLANSISSETALRDADQQLLTTKIAETFQFNVPLTLEERQLFEYVNFGYIEHNPADGPYVVAGYGTLQQGDAYVGDYSGAGPTVGDTGTLVDTSSGDDSNFVLLFSSDGIPLVDPELVPLTLQNMDFNLSTINTKLNSIS